MNDNKEEIIQSRVGGLGSSDAAFVVRIGKRESIEEADKFRLAVMLGIEETKIFSSSQTELGNIIEERIFNFVQSKYTNAQSNPKYVSAKLSKKYGFDILNHIDFEIIESDKLIQVEHKSTIKSLSETYNQYKEQLYWHYILGLEKAKELGLSKYELRFSHYNTSEISDINDFVLEDRLYTSLLIGDEKNFKNGQDNSLKDYILNGLQIISDAIIINRDEFVSAYVKKETIDANTLPEKQLEIISAMAKIVSDIESKELELKEFKAKMYNVMKANNIKSIKNEYFTMTLVEDHKMTKFDSKAFEIDRPNMYKKYLKVSNVKGSLKINVKKEKN